MDINTNPIKVQINRFDLGGVSQTARDILEKSNIPARSDNIIDTAITSFLNTLLGEGNWRYKEEEFEPVEEKDLPLNNLGDKRMDFANVKTIEELLKLAATKTAIDPKYDERLLTKEDKPLAKSEAEESAFQSSESAESSKGDLEHAMKGKEQVAKNRLKQIEDEEKAKWNEGTFAPLKPEDYTY